MAKAPARTHLRTSTHSHIRFHTKLLTKETLMKHHHYSSMGRATVLLAAAAALVLGFSSNVLAQATGEGVTNYVPEEAIKQQEVH